MGVMTHTGPVPMRVTFYGGPADGGELALSEPLPPALAFPMTHVRAAAVLATTDGSAWAHVIPACGYKVVLDGRRLLRDSRHRVIYAYVPAIAPAKPGNPTEGEPTP